MTIKSGNLSKGRVYNPASTTTSYSSAAPSKAPRVRSGDRHADQLFSSMASSTSEDDASDEAAEEQLAIQCRKLGARIDAFLVEAQGFSARLRKLAGDIDQGAAASANKLATRLLRYIQASKDTVQADPGQACSEMGRARNGFGKLASQLDCHLASQARQPDQAASELMVELHRLQGTAAGLFDAAGVLSTEYQRLEKRRGDPGTEQRLERAGKPLQAAATSMPADRGSPPGATSHVRMKSGSEQAARSDEKAGDGYDEALVSKQGLGRKEAIFFIGRMQGPAADAKNMIASLLQPQWLLEARNRSQAKGIPGDELIRKCDELVALRRDMESGLLALRERFPRERGFSADCLLSETVAAYLDVLWALENMPADHDQAKGRLMRACGKLAADAGPQRQAELDMNTIVEKTKSLERVWSPLLDEWLQRLGPLSSYFGEAQAEHISNLKLRRKPGHLRALSSPRGSHDEARSTQSTTAKEQARDALKQQLSTLSENAGDVCLELKGTAATATELIPLLQACRDWLNVAQAKRHMAEIELALHRARHVFAMFRTALRRALFPPQGSRTSDASGPQTKKLDAMDAGFASAIESAMHQTVASPIGRGEATSPSQHAGHGSRKRRALVKLRSLSGPKKSSATTSNSPLKPAASNVAASSSNAPATTNEIELEDSNDPDESSSLD